MRVLLFAALAAAVSCQPPPKPAVVPTLPGDGDANTAKPPPSRVKTVDDPWAGKELITDAPVPPTPVALAPLESYKLGNGLQVYVIHDERLPVVSVQLAIKAGRAEEPRARLGVAELTADMLVKGTRHRDAAAIAKSIDYVGGTITADATFEATLLSCSVLRRDLSACLSLVPEMAEEPAFDAKELDRQRDAMRGSVAQRLKDPAALASMEVQNLLWGEGHVRAWVNSEASVAAITRDDVVTWHKTWFTPGNAILVVTGDVDGKRIRGDLDRAFGGWTKSGPIPPTPIYPEPGLSGTRIRLVDWPGSPQTQIRIAQFGIKHDDARFFDALVFNHVLGGGTGSRLGKALRAGGTSSFDRNTDRGSFVVQTVARNADAMTATKLALGEITRMQKEGPSEDEVASAVASIGGSWGMRFQSAADIGAALIGAELHGFGIEYLANFGIAVSKVDVASAKRAASEILDSKNFVIVMVGDAKDLEPLLKKEGFRYEKVAFTDPITPMVVAPVDAKSLAEARALIDAAVVAKGGKDKLAAVTSIRFSAKGTTIVGNRPAIPVNIERVFVIPDKLRIEAVLTPTPNATPTRVVYGADGAKGWVAQPDANGGTSIDDIPPAEMGSLDFDRWRDPDIILLHAAQPNAKLTPLPDDVIDGKNQSVVRLASPFAGIDVTLYFDKKTKLMTRMTYTDRGFTSTDDFSDYQDEKGIKIARKRPSHDKNRITSLDITRVEINVTIDPLTFQKPAPVTTPKKPVP